MKKLMMLFAVGAAILITGCCATKIEYEKDDTGKVSYRLYRNDHWLKTSASGLRGGMSNDGKFEFSAEGLEKSPSEEFNRTMMTYTSAIVQLMQIAAAAYNPSASGVVAAKTAEPAAQTVVNVQPAAETSAASVQPAAETSTATAEASTAK